MIRFFINFFVLLHKVCKMLFSTPYHTFGAWHFYFLSTFISRYIFLMSRLLCGSFFGFSINIFNFSLLSDHSLTLFIMCFDYFCHNLHIFALWIFTLNFFGTCLGVYLNSDIIQSEIIINIDSFYFI